MPDLGLEVLFKGRNFARLLEGLWVAGRISLISIVISLPLGILLGVIMTWKNPVTKFITRIYLEIIRIMPQMVLLFIVFFGTTRIWGWNLSGNFFYYCICSMGYCEGRSGAKCADQYSQASVRECTGTGL